MEPSRTQNTREENSEPTPLGGLVDSLFRATVTERPRFAVGWMVVRVVAAYLVGAVLWIFVTGEVLSRLVSDPKRMAHLEMVKGWGFVAITALLLFVVLRREARHWAGEREARENAEAASNKRGQRQQLLLEISRLAWDTSDDEQRFVESVMARVGPHIQADLCLYYRLDPGARELALVGSVGVPREKLSNVERIGLEQSLSGVAASTGRTVSVDASQLEVDARAGLARSFGLKAYTSHPLLGRDGGVLGTLSFASSTRTSFSPDEIGFLQIASRFASIATERVRAMNALRESEERFRQVVENMDQVFWMNDPQQKRVLYVSPAFAKIWGRSMEAVYSSIEGWAATLHPEDRERLVDAVTKKQPLGTYDEVYRIVRPSGEVRWIHDRAFPVFDGSGKVYRIVGTATDVTDRRRLEDQLRQSQKMEAIGTLAGGIAHDFNNILGAILGHAELAQLDTTSPAALKSLDEILLACRRAGDLVRQILTFSRKQERPREPQQLSRVINEAVRLLRAALPSTIAFEIKLSPDAPPVLADPTQIHQAVVNLCTNAAHAMTGRQGNLVVTLDRFEADETFARTYSGARVGAYARLTVSDNGRGMDKATMDRMFEPFFTTKGPGEGSGLGLAVVHGVVQNHQGVVMAYSQPGQGSVFQLYFPAYDGAEAPPAAVPALSSKGRGDRVLVVDDEEVLARMAGRVLERLGYQPEVTSNPLQALELVKAAPEKFRAALVDLTMPGMTGVELAEEMKRLNAGLAVILVTGFLPKETKEQLQTAGVTATLLKPVTMQMLGEALHRALNEKPLPA